MASYILRRLILLAPTLVGVSVIVFFLLRVIPGDVAVATLGEDATPQALAEFRAKLGLDRLIYVQYAAWVADVLRGELGTSLWTHRPVAQEVLRVLPVTLELTLMTILISVALGAPAGVLSAIRPNRALDYGVRVLSIGGLAMPGFWLATLMLVLPSLWFQWVPPPGYRPLWEDIGTNVQQFIFPAMAMGAYSAAFIARMTRSSLLEVLRQDYIRTAWSKGLAERLVLARHALKNAAIPVLTLVGNQVGYLLGGAFIMESIFSLPGIGRLTLDAISHRDFILVQTNVLIVAFFFVTINLAVDMLYVLVDPRVRYT